MSSDKWDSRYLDLAGVFAQWSKDKTKVGAIAVGKNRTLLAQGYNGFPRGIMDCPNFYADRIEKYNRVVHAEMNVIYNAAFNGISLMDSVVYVHGLPVCGECAKGLIQVGVSRVVVRSAGALSMHWVDSCKRAEQFFAEAGVLYEGNRIDINQTSTGIRRIDS